MGALPLLLDKAGCTSLSLLTSPESLAKRLGIARRAVHAFEKEWPASEEGQRLLAALRWAADSCHAGQQKAALAIESHAA